MKQKLMGILWIKKEKIVMSLFSANIKGKKDWEKVFRSVSAFTPLIEHILYIENLPVTKIENLKPGTNAVFKAGEYVVKVYAPEESDFKQDSDIGTELFAAQRAYHTGVNTPKIIASGMIKDKYEFDYMIIEYIEGVEFDEAVEKMTDDEKLSFARNLRRYTDLMNVPCEPFNRADAINDDENNWSWEPYPKSFRNERIKYIKSHNYGENVFVHGDLCGDNILITPDKELYIIDFADALCAPAVYEHSLVAAELFDFDEALMYGYFFTNESVIDTCLDGILIHGYGGDIIKYHLGRPNEFQHIEQLHQRITERLHW